MKGWPQDPKARAADWQHEPHLSSPRAVAASQAPQEQRLRERQFDQRQVPRRPFVARLGDRINGRGIINYHYCQHLIDNVDIQPQEQH